MIHTHQCRICTDEFECGMEEDCDIESNSESCLCDDCAADLDDMNNDYEDIDDVPDEEL